MHHFFHSYDQFERVMVVYLYLVFFVENNLSGLKIHDLLFLELVIGSCELKS